MPWTDQWLAYTHVRLTHRCSLPLRRQFIEKNITHERQRKIKTQTQIEHGHSLLDRLLKHQKLDFNLYKVFKGRSITAPSRDPL